MNYKKTACFSTLSSLMLLFPALSMADTVTPPDAGSRLRDIEKKINTETPSFIPNLPFQKEPSEPVSPPKNEIRFFVRSFRFEGNTQFPEAALQDAVKQATGKEYSLADLEEVVSIISRYYWDHHYPLAYAYLPPQDIKGGVVKIAVVEGHYGEAKLKNDSYTKDEVIKRFFAGEKDHNPVVNSERLERFLNILKEATATPEITGLFGKGKEAKSSDLEITIKKPSRVMGNIEANNYGSDYTGKEHLESSLSWNNPLGIGDQFNTKLLTSGENENFALLGYTLPIGVKGWRLGTSYTRSEYKLGKDFESLDAHGHADKWSLDVTYPLQRSYSRTLNFDVNLTHKSLQDDIDSVLFKNHKKIYSITAGFDGQLRWNRLNQSVYTLLFENGKIRADASQSFFDFNINDYTLIRNTTRDSFTKISYSLMHEFAPSATTSLIVKVNGQYAFQNLDSSEKIALGGPYAIRAYNMGTVSGDTGYVANIEFHHRVRSPISNGLLDLMVFMDTGEVKVNVDPLANEPNRRDLTGAGLGVGWQLPYKTSLQFIYAMRIRGDVPGDSNPKARSWLQLIKNF